MAQSGSVLGLDPRGRRFKSYYPDQMKEALKRLMGRFDPLNVLEWGYDAHETIEELLDDSHKEPSPLEITAAEMAEEKELNE